MPCNEGRRPDKPYWQKLQSDDFNIIGSRWEKYLEPLSRFRSFDTHIENTSG